MIPPPNTEVKVKASTKLLKDGVYAITITVSTNIYPKIISGTVEYAGESDIMTDGKTDQSKVREIANSSINAVMRWKNDTQNIDYPIIYGSVPFTDIRLFK